MLFLCKIINIDNLDYRTKKSSKWKQIFKNDSFFKTLFYTLNNMLETYICKSGKTFP